MKLYHGTQVQDIKQLKPFATRGNAISKPVICFTPNYCIALLYIWNRSYKWITFSENENGKVVFEKSTRDCVIRRAKTDCSLYPISYLNWIPAKNSFHGVSPITSLIPNQKFINRAYAMAMKHMTDTAFSKIIYAWTLILQK